MMQKKCIVNIESIIAEFLMDKMFRAEKKTILPIMCDSSFVIDSFL